MGSDMLDYVRNIVAEAEHRIAGQGVEAALAVLRELPFDDFGALFLSFPNPEFPHLSANLPAMASAETQRNWTGSDGYPLLKTTLNFTRIASHVFLQERKRSLSDARILDFGCGYGRILRTMYYFTNPTNLYACDPWDVSINLCKEAGILAHLAMSDYLPTRLPFEGRFDFIYAFSVFTHLSERATRQCLDTLIHAVDPAGMIAITIRPVEYWQADQAIPEGERRQRINAHERDGFAFWPHQRAAVDGDVTYGDTSMTIDYLQRNFPQLKVVRVERTLEDPYQFLVFLVPAQSAAQAEA